MSKLVITGCGRSGTGFMAMVLRECGIACGHENVFHPYGIPTWNEYEADSSWLAVPWLQTLSPDFSVLHLVRDPLQCARSFWHFFVSLERNEFHRAIAEFAPWVEWGQTALERFCIYWIEWNRLAELRADTTVKIEQVDAPIIRSIMVMRFGVLIDENKAKAAIDAVGTKYNTRYNRNESITWDQLLATRVGVTLARTAERYGYTPEQERQS